MIAFNSLCGNAFYRFKIVEFGLARSARKNCQVLFVDSGILRQNEDRSIDKIIKLQRFGDIVAPPDIIEDRSQTISNTLEWYKKIKHFFPIRNICFVLQGKNVSDYIKCFEELNEHIPDIKFVGIGGLQHSSKNERNIRYCVGELIPFFHNNNIIMHMFGLGIKWIPFLKMYNPFSFDSSTPTRYAISGIVLDNNLKEHLLYPSVKGLGTKRIEYLYYINTHQIDNFIQDKKPVVQSHITDDMKEYKFKKFDFQSDIDYFCNYYKEGDKVTGSKIIQKTREYR